MEENGGPQTWRWCSEGEVSFGATVRISNEKIKFAKSAEQNFSTEIFRIAKVIVRRPRPLYELEDLNGTPL